MNALKPCMPVATYNHMDMSLVGAFAQHVEQFAFSSWAPFARCPHLVHRFWPGPKCGACKEHPAIQPPAADQWRHVRRGNAQVHGKFHCCNSGAAGTKLTAPALLATLAK